MLTGYSIMRAWRRVCSCRTGLVGLRAIACIGITLQAQMTHISERMLWHAVVTTRAVLAYIADKKHALREFTG